MLRHVYDAEEKTHVIASDTVTLSNLIFMHFTNQEPSITFSILKDPAIFSITLLIDKINKSILPLSKSASLFGKQIGRL
ncbi:hypothetical protein A0J61_09317 [Choanephora cucurbitarum]|uniref:Uncharacterized protein n=1 Tax=Choanephora cucurbitarum TaxID=101091 RepID=A0A1C7N0N1_9FUNG|nr:hypothetical protein A0J61_09317 [Choanephora cucurbitarum]